MCWICKFQRIVKEDWTTHNSLKKALKKYFEPKYEYNDTFSEAEYYD